MSVRVRCHWRIVSAFVLAAWALQPWAGNAQEALAPEPAADIARIQRDIETLKNANEVDEAIKTQALEVYAQALARARERERYASTWAKTKARAASAPEAMSSIRDSLQNRPEPTLPAELNEKGVEGLRAWQAQHSAKLTELRTTLQRREAEITAQTARPAIMREELTRARERLTAVEGELAVAPAEPSDPLAAARAELLQARLRARTAEIQMLEQEGAVYDVHVNLLKAERDLDQLLVAEAEQVQTQIDTLVAAKVQAQARQAQVDAEQARRDVEKKHPLLLAIAKENERLSGVNARLVQDVEQVAEDLRTVERRLKETEDAHASAQDKLAKVGLSGLLGDIFAELRRKIPDGSKQAALAMRRRPKVAEVRAAQLRLDEVRKELVQVGETARRLVANVDDSLKEDQRRDLESEVQALLTQQATLIDNADATHTSYLTTLGELDYKDEQLREKRAEYAAFLDEHLLWTPNASTFGKDTLKQLPRSALWMASPTNWANTLRELLTAARQKAAATATAFLVALVLVLSYRRLRKRLASLADGVGKFSDRFSLTLRALLCTVGISATFPFVLGFLGWLLRTATVSDPFARSVGHALLSVSMALSCLLAYYVFCAPKGVAAVHFRWSAEARKPYRAHLKWFFPLAVLLHFTVCLTEAYEDRTHTMSLGRAAFVSGMVLVAIFASRVLSPSRGVLRHAIGRKRNSWLSRLRFLWYGVAVVGPIALGVLALVGYQHSARQLGVRAAATVLVVVGGVVAFHLGVRWLVIARRRLAIQRAREKREAAIAAAEQADGATPGVEGHVVEDVPEIDLETVQEQSRGVFLLAVFSAVIALVGVVWADMLPALTVLDRELWSVQETVGGEEMSRSITIASVVLAVVCAFLSLISSRNLPGLLEVAGFSKLPIDRGSRYAISTIGQYVLLAVGAILTFYMIGIGWTHVQWLVAALGVGLGFGLQEIFANFVSGLIILLERPVRVGDTVTIGEVSGTVSRIRIRATTITDWDLKELVVPNKSFITGQLINWSLSNPVTRLKVPVGIEYGSDTELALRLMHEVARDHPNVIDEPSPDVFFVGFGASSLDFEVRVFVSEVVNRSRTQVVHDLHMAIDQAFRRHGVVIAFPQLDLHVRSNASAPSADAATPDDEE